MSAAEVVAMCMLKCLEVLTVEHSAEGGWKGLFPHHQLTVADEETREGEVVTPLNDTHLTDLLSLAIMASVTLKQSIKTINFTESRSQLNNITASRVTLIFSIKILRITVP